MTKLLPIKVPRERTSLNSGANHLCTLRLPLKTLVDPPPRPLPSVLYSQNSAHVETQISGKGKPNPAYEALDTVVHATSLLLLAR